MRKITNKIFDVYTAVDNVEVTDHYIRMIETALTQLGYSINRIQKIEYSRENESKGIIAITPGIVIRAKKAGYNTIIYWAQGIVPEESFLRNNKRWDKYARRWILSKLEKNALISSDFVLFVSESMIRHFVKKYNYTPKNYYVMPCFNEEIEKALFFTDGKYTENVFTYAGSLAPWQCFDQTARIYSYIEKKVSNAKFRVLVKDGDAAEKILLKYGIKNYSIGFVPKEQVQEEMAKAKFGFCIREENEINRVATPTKLSSYISSGVMPIYSPVVKDFNDIAVHCQYCFDVSSDAGEEGYREIVEICNNATCAEDVYSSYQKYFGKYYSKKYHVERLATALSALF